MFLAVLSNDNILKALRFDESIFMTRFDMVNANIHQYIATGVDHPVSPLGGDVGDHAGFPGFGLKITLHGIQEQVAGAL